MILNNELYGSDLIKYSRHSEALIIDIPSIESLQSITKMYSDINSSFFVICGTIQTARSS